MFMDPKNCPTIIMNFYTIKNFSPKKFGASLCKYVLHNNTSFSNAL